MPKISFEDILKTLNERQRLAVESIEGPVLIIAGPGTGKTQILAARIANILKQTDSLPQNILCLTYTDAGAVAMRKRLLDFIGPDAYKVDIFTFHAFCNSVIQENLEWFGLRNLDAISELGQIEIVRQIIDAFPKNHPLKRYTGDIYFESGKLLNLYQAMKQEHWSPEFLIQKTDEYIADVPNREEFIYKKDSKYGKKGELKPAGHDAIKRMEQLKAAALTFTTYQQKLKQRNCYDFADMIIWVIDAFKAQPELLSNYQERYLYFLVDEFQDTSGSQGELLQLLLDYWERPNIFAVGDDDQSIYRFQGANVENIIHFEKQYLEQDLLKITLEENYRSSQNILDAARNLIRKNQVRLDPDKTLLARNKDYAGLELKPEIKAYYNTAHEAVCIAKEIEKLHDAGVALKEIAVLYRKHQQADELIKYLQGKNIAVNTRRRADILQEPLTRKITKLLQYLNAERTKAHSGEHLLYEILHFDFFGLEPVELARLSVAISKSKYHEQQTKWRDELRRTADAKPDLFSGTSPLTPFQKASKKIENWIQDSHNLTLQQLIEKMLAESGILVNALGDEDKAWNMQVLHTLFDFVKSESSRNPKTNLSSLMHTLELMEQEGVALPAERVLFAKDGVNFLSTHASKGLEFETVFLMGCTTRAWEKASNNFDFKLPDTIFEVNSQEKEEENRRLFYVAMTRAKKELRVSFAERDLNDKELEKSRFVAELETEAGIEVTPAHAHTEAMIEFDRLVMQPRQPAAHSSLFSNPFVDELLEKYSLSVTHLNNYLKCPTAFYFNNLIRVPAPMSAAATFGSAVHYALEMLFRNMNNHPKKQFSGVTELLNDFKWFMLRNEENFTDAELKRRMEYAEEILPEYYQRYINEWNKITSVERTYRNVVMEGVPINGKIDKLEFDGKWVNVVDYKTGNYEKAKAKFKTPNPDAVFKAEQSGKEPLFEDVHGGDYWRQGVFYKILMDYDRNKEWEMRSAEFDFVEPDKDSGEFFRQRILLNHEDIETVKRQIKETYERIIRKDFAKGCGKPDCEWCGFVSDYYGGRTPDMS